MTDQQEVQAKFLQHEQPMRGMRVALQEFPEVTYEDKLETTLLQEPEAEEGKQIDLPAEVKAAEGQALKSPKQELSNENKSLLVRPHMKSCEMFFITLPVFSGALFSRLTCLCA